MNKANQRGVVIVVSMIILMLLTLIGASVLSTVTLDERMAGNVRDKQLAEEDAESAVRDGEAWIASLDWDDYKDRRVITGVLDAPVEGGANTIWRTAMSDYKLLESSIVWSLQLEEWWAKYAIESDSLRGMKADWNPRYIVEEEMMIPDSARHSGYSRGGYQSGQYYYRITSRGNGFFTGRATLQSTFAKRYN